MAPARDLPLRLRRAAGRNAGLKLLALFLAVVLWWFVAGENKVQVGFVVPLEVRNVPAGLAIANKVQREVEISLVGPPSLVGSLPPSGMSVAIDLSEARAGRASVPIQPQAVKVPPGVKVQRIYPNVVDVELQKLERRLLPVDARTPPELRPRIRQIDVVPARLEVEAPAGEFDVMRRLQTEEIVPDTDRGTFRTDARVDLRNAHAKIVGSPVVRVTITFRRQGNP